MVRPPRSFPYLPTLHLSTFDTPISSHEANMQYGLGFPAGNGKENHGWRLSITTLVVLVLATVFVVLRFIARVHGSKVGWDDATIVLSWVCATLPSSSLHRWCAHRELDADFGDYFYFYFSSALLLLMPHLCFSPLSTAMACTYTTSLLSRSA